MTLLDLKLGFGIFCGVFFGIGGLFLFPFLRVYSFYWVVIKRSTPQPRFTLNPIPSLFKLFLFGFILSGYACGLWWVSGALPLLGGYLLLQIPLGSIYALGPMIRFWRIPAPPHPGTICYTKVPGIFPLWLKLLFPGLWLFGWMEKRMAITRMQAAGWTYPPPPKSFSQAQASPRKKNQQISHSQAVETKATLEVPPFEIPAASPKRVTLKGSGDGKALWN